MVVAINLMLFYDIYILTLKVCILNHHKLNDLPVGLLIKAVKRRRTGELKKRGKSTNSPLMLTRKKLWQTSVLNSSLANVKCESFIIIKNK